MQYLKIAVDFLEDTEDLTDSEFGRLIKAMMKYAESDDYKPTFKGKESGKWLTARKGIKKQWQEYRDLCERNKRNRTSRDEPKRETTSGNGTSQYEYEHEYKSDSLKEKSIKKERHKYGRYKQVLLSDEDMEKLKTEFPDDYEQRIARLDEYIATSGKSYKNHLAVIRKWAEKDKPKAVPTPTAPSAGDTAEIRRLLEAM